MSLSQSIASTPRCPSSDGVPPTCSPSIGELRSQAHHRLDAIIDFCLAPIPARSFLSFESTLLTSLFSLACLLIQLFLLHRHQQVDLAPWFSRGYRLAEACATRTLKTVFGPVTYGRAYLILKRGEGPGVHPLDIELGLTRDSYCPLVIGWFCRLATRLSFRLSSELGKTFLGCAPSASTIEEWVLGLGRPAHLFLSTASLPQGDGEVLITEIDGKAAPTATAEELAKRRGKRQEHEKGCECGCQRHRSRVSRKRRGRKKKRKKGDKSKNGRSATLVTMYTMTRGADGKLHGPINKKVYATFGSRKKAVEWTRKQATRRGFGPDTTKTIQILFDGEVCLEQRMSHSFPKAIKTLDIRHAQEKLWEVGRLFCKEGSEELTARVEKLETMLFQGECEALLAELKKMLNSVATRGPGTRKKRKTLNSVIEYLEKRKTLMQYGKWRQGDLVIASGVVEGAARYVVGERLDNAGMRWIEERAEPLLLLRCIEVNGDWHSFWQWYETQRFRDLCKGCAVQIRSKVPTQLPEDP